MDAPNTLTLYKQHRRQVMIRWLSWLSAAPLVAVLFSVAVPRGASTYVGAPAVGAAMAVIVVVAAATYFRYLWVVYRIDNGQFGKWKSEAMELAAFAVRRRVGA